MKYQRKIDCRYEISADFDSVYNVETNVLKISCHNCPNNNNIHNKALFSSICFNNLIKLSVKFPNLTGVTIESEKNTLNLLNSQIEILSNYSKGLSKIYGFLKIPNLHQKMDCTKGFECESKKKFFFERIFGNEFNDGLLISNPILAYTEINYELNLYKQIQEKKIECKNCYKAVINCLSELNKILNETQIIKKFLSIPSRNRESSEIFSIIFGDYNLISEDLNEDLIIPDINENICKLYQKGPYKIRIVRDSLNEDYYYLVSSILEDPTLKEIYTVIMKLLNEKSTEYFNYKQQFKLNFLLKSKKEFINQLIKQEYGLLSSDLNDKLAELITFEFLNLNPLMAFLIDDEIEEIFLDSPKSFIYLDHREFGRCKTEIKLTNTEIESFKTRIRIESEQRLDQLQPFIKSELVSEYFHIRVAIQIYPLSIDGFSMSIRKLHKKILTIIDLITNNTLTIDAVVYLLFNLICGRCILVIGEPYSGKTTLINSLDMLGEKAWRKIYIEDVIESIDQSPFGVHQLRFQVNPIIGTSENYSNKSFQVKECLHRTPDLIFIGELIHPKSVKSLFFLLKVGLRRCLATAHGESPELMIERFIFDDQIPPSLIGNLDIIVQLSRINFGGRTIRRVTRITEIKKKPQIGINETNLQDKATPNITFNDIFLRDSKSDRLTQTFQTLSELYRKSNTITKINSLRGTYFNENDFISTFNSIKSFIIELLERNEIKMDKIIKLFHQFWQRSIKVSNMPRYKSLYNEVKC
ncbi:MAG: ATPase, T2SS/T4P/T4SS family [Candidatus Helarchaeota archaeon]